MDAAATAVSSLLKAGTKDTQEPPTDVERSSKTGAKDTTVDQEIKPAVTNEHVHKTHEERVQHVVDKEKHQDHYHTTIQPLKDSEVKPEVHDHKVAETRERNINKDDGSVPAKVAARENDITGSKTENATVESKTQEATVSGEHVHHHLHETIQPVIEKGESDVAIAVSSLTSSETIKPSVTHTTVPIHEHHQEQAVDHGVTKNVAMSVDDFKKTVNDPSTSKQVHKEFAGAPKVNESKD